MVLAELFSLLYKVIISMRKTYLLAEVEVRGQRSLRELYWHFLWFRLDVFLNFLLFLPWRNLEGLLLLVLAAINLFDPDTLDQIVFTMALIKTESIDVQKLMVNVPLYSTFTYFHRLAVLLRNSDHGFGREDGRRGGEDVSSIL